MPPEPRRKRARAWPLWRATLMCGAATVPHAHALTLSHQLSWPAPSVAHPASHSVAHPVAHPAPAVVTALPITEVTPEAPARAATTWPALLSRLDQAAGSREAQARAEASDALSDQSRARAWWPRLDASARAEDQRQRYNGIASRTPSSAASLNATWPLWRPADRAEARAQAATAEQAHWQARQRQQALARELSQSYLGAVEAAEQWHLTRLHLAALHTQAQAHHKRLQAGLGTVLDLLETRTRQEQAQARSERLLARVRLLTLTLGRLSGLTVAPPRGLRPHQPDAANLSLPPLDDATAQALSRHPEVQDAQAGLRASREAASARTAERWQPTLDATASRSRTRQTQRFEGLSDRQDVRTDAVGLVLNWPLFSSGLQQARQREAAALLGAAQARLDDAEARVSTELQDAYLRQDQAQRQQARQEAVVASTQATLDAVQKAWLAGLRSTTDLLDAQQQVHEARMAWASARIATVQAGADALALLDRLDSEHIAPWLDLFDAQALSLTPANLPANLP
ncbi:MAG: TolC family protein [Burkholderiales bacterium]|nr:TolC family protein [Burkholderiales bacterium]